MTPARQEGKAQVSIEHAQQADGPVERSKIRTVVILSRHAEPLKAVTSKEVARHSDHEETVPSIADMNKPIIP